MNRLLSAFFFTLTVIFTQPMHAMWCCGSVDAVQAFPVCDIDPAHIYHRARDLYGPERILVCDHGATLASNDFLITLSHRAEWLVCNTLEFRGCRALNRIERALANVPVRRLRIAEAEALQDIQELPHELYELSLYACWQMRTLPTLPTYLQELYLEGNEVISTLPTLPESLRYLNIHAYTRLQRVNIPEGTQEVTIIDCPEITDLVIPDSVQRLCVNGVPQVRQIRIPTHIKHLTIPADEFVHIIDVADCARRCNELEMLIVTQAYEPRLIALCKQACTRIRAAQPGVIIPNEKYMPTPCRLGLLSHPDQIPAERLQIAHDGFIDLANAQITGFSPDFFELLAARYPTITSIDLSDNPITALPNEIAVLGRTLHKIGLCATRIDHWPEVLNPRSLPNLNRVCVTSTPLTRNDQWTFIGQRIEKKTGYLIIPKHLSAELFDITPFLETRYTKMSFADIKGVLNLSKCGISALNDTAIEQMGMLSADGRPIHRLDLSNNPIQILPAEIADLHDLKALDLTDTRIARWQPTLTLMPNLTSVYLANTPLVTEYPGTWRRLKTEICALRRAARLPELVIMDGADAIPAVDTTETTSDHD